MDLLCPFYTKINFLLQTKFTPIFIPWDPENGKKLPNNLDGWSFHKIAKFVLTKKVYK